MKKAVIMKRNVKKKLRGNLELIKLSLYRCSDYWNYTRRSATLSQGGGGKSKEYLFRKEVHKLEKGLSLPEMRPWFGINVIRNLRNMLEGEGVSAVEVENLYGVLKCYISLNAPYKSCHVTLEVKDLVSTIEKKWNTSLFLSEIKPGLKEEVLENYFVSEGIGCNSFLLNRRSVREFVSSPISDALNGSIHKLVSRVPTVCNRRTTQCILLRDKVLIDKVLNLQNGNAGFRSCIYNLGVIFADQRAFVGAKERNQPYIDGGIMVSHLLSALHSLELVSCPLNWSSSPKEDKLLLKELGMSRDFLPIALVAFGHPKPVIKYAASERV